MKFLQIIWIVIIIPFLIIWGVSHYRHYKKDNKNK